MKIRRVIGPELLKEKLEQLNPNPNKRIIAREIYLKLVQDNEIRSKVINAKGYYHRRIVCDGNSK
jgi:hypothetical protein